MKPRSRGAAASPAFPLGVTLITVVVHLSAMALAPVDASAANTCTLTTTQATTTWGRVHQLDRMRRELSRARRWRHGNHQLRRGFNLKVDAFLNPVILQISGLVD